MGHSPLARITLPQVTLCAASSVNIDATLRALEISLAQADFGACKLFTDASLCPDNPGIEVIPISRLRSANDYSDFILNAMVDHVDTSHCLIVQWDGHVLDAAHWRPDFLDYDYIGARWPQFDDGYNVGNGGFSLRSRRLMEACRHPGFQPHSVEDIAIGRINRDFLEGRGIRFAPAALADLFSTERAGNISASFGYHGAWLMPDLFGASAFWDIYHTLDDRGTIRHDFAAILEQLRTRQGGWVRALRLIGDQIVHADGRRRLKKLYASRMKGESA